MLTTKQKAIMGAENTFALLKALCPKNKEYHEVLMEVIKLLVKYLTLLGSHKGVVIVTQVLERDRIEVHTMYLEEGLNGQPQRKAKS